MYFEASGKLIFRYPGGKSRRSARQKILSYFPETFSEYREPMVGGGGIFFAIPTEVKRWVNDLDRNLMSVYFALQDRPKSFIEDCRAIPKMKPGEPLASSKPGGKPLYNARLKKWFDFFAKNEEVDQALRYLFIHRTVWAGRVNYDIESRMYYSNPTGWNLIHTDKMEQAAERLQGVTITCGDYEPLLTEPGEDVVIYIDPPYYMNTELDLNSRLYKHNFEVEDHQRLCELIKACRHKVVLSYDDHPAVRSMYEGFRIHSESWTYCGTSSAEGQSSTKQKGKELVIVNF